MVGYGLEGALLGIHRVHCLERVGLMQHKAHILCLALEALAYKRPLDS
jgi:hypothetical protein